MTTNQLSAVTNQLAAVNAQIDAYLREQTYNYDDLNDFMNEFWNYDNSITTERLIDAINAERDVPVVMTNPADFLAKWMNEGKQPTTLYYNSDIDKFESLETMEWDAMQSNLTPMDVRHFISNLDLTDEQIALIDPREDIIDQLIELFADKELAFRWDHFYEHNDYWTKDRYSSEFARYQNVKEILARIED